MVGLKSFLNNSDPVLVNSLMINLISVRQQYKRVIDDDNDDAPENGEDDDIATTIVRVSLQCPLVKFRMQYPAKGKNCGHLQCFDGSAYISLNEKKPMWMCPVCSRPLYYDDLVLDQLVFFEFSNMSLKMKVPRCSLWREGGAMTLLHFYPE